MWSRQQCEAYLNQVFHIPGFHDDQWEIIQKILMGKRVLAIQRTGFGKSLCYQFPSLFFPGITLVLSPLIALMRDQVRQLQELKLPVGAINSQQYPGTNRYILKLATTGKLKLLYLAPERIHSRQWLKNLDNLQISFIAIDEAHCISVWGHDFRPDYRRLVELTTERFPQVPTLAMSASLTSSAINDIKNQIGENMEINRGPLVRSNIALNVISIKDESERWCRLGMLVKNNPPPGIIYCGTRERTEQAAQWLRTIGISAEFYHAGLPKQERQTRETRFFKNEISCLTATNALGMGINKSNLRYIIHAQMPGSLMEYYQEIGRAGRDGQPASAVLFFHEQDRHIREFFINTHRPHIKYYQQILTELNHTGFSIQDFARKCQLDDSMVKRILVDLMEQNIVKKNDIPYPPLFKMNLDPEWFDYDRVEEIRICQFDELIKIMRYIELKTCRMNYICSYLGQEITIPCGICDQEKKTDQKLRGWESMVKTYQTYTTQISKKL